MKQSPSNVYLSEFEQRMDKLAAEIKDAERALCILRNEAASLLELVRLIQSVQS